MTKSYAKVKRAIINRRIWIDSLKSGKRCLDCHRKYPPYVMDFHHRNPRTKLFGIAAARFRVSRARLAAEITKCDLICGNCHRIREYETRR